MSNALKVVTLGAITALLPFLAVVPGTVAATPSSAQTDLIQIDSAATWAHDLKAAADAVAKEYGIDPVQALAQLTAQGELKKVDTSWDPGFVSLYSEYGTEYSIRYLTRSAEGKERVESALRSILPVPFTLEFTTVALGENELHEASARVAEAAPQTAKFSSDFDLTTSSIVYFVASEPSSEIRDAVTKAASPATVRWELTSETAVPFVGGGGALFNFSSGNCTSGFVVQVSGGTNRGVSGAGHCNAAYNYSSPNGTYLTTVQSHQSGPADVAWYDNVSVSWDPTFYVGSSPNRPVDGTLSYDQLGVGDFVCKYGQADGMRCGTITTNTYRPSSDAIPNATNTWPRTNIEGCRGDSGGPVFAGNVAIGILSGGIVDGPADNCGPIYYSPQNRLGPNLGVYVRVQ